jgi:hypothetical protein
VPLSSLGLGPVPASLGIPDGPSAGAGVARTAQIVRYSAHEVEIEAEAAAGGVLVLTDSF